MKQEDRICRKFSHQYKIITTTDVELAEKNILVFPQERAFAYIDKLPSIDILIVVSFIRQVQILILKEAPLYSVQW